MLGSTLGDTTVLWKEGHTVLLISEDASHSRATDLQEDFCLSHSCILPDLSSLCPRVLLPDQTEWEQRRLPHWPRPPRSQTSSYCDGLKFNSSDTTISAPLIGCRWHMIKCFARKVDAGGVEMTRCDRCQLGALPKGCKSMWVSSQGKCIVTELAGRYGGRGEPEQLTSLQYAGAYQSDHLF